MQRSRLVILASAVMLFGGCTGAEPAREQPPAQAAVHTPYPRPLGSRAETEARMLRHYPPHLLARGVSGSALLDVVVGADGTVQAVHVATPPASAGTTTAVFEDRDPRTGKVTTHTIEPVYDPAFAAAAQAVVRETRFRPTLRDGRPVTDTLRMGIHFAPPDAAS